MIHHVGIVASQPYAESVLRLMQRLSQMSVIGTRRIEEWRCDCWLYEVVTPISKGCSVHGARFELVIPYEGSPLLRWLHERQAATGHASGLHHFAVQVPDVRAMSAQLKKAFVPLVSEEPVEGVCNTLVNFIHPKYLGIMVELVEVRS